MELDLQPGDVVKVLESAALGWVRARVIRVKSGGRVVVQSDQGREFTARGNQVRLIEPGGFRPWRRPFCFEHRVAMTPSNTPMVLHRGICVGIDFESIRLSSNPCSESSS